MNTPPHEILGIEKDASKKEIKKAFRELIKIHHPDQGGDPDTFKQINSAYIILTNPDILCYLHEFDSLTASDIDAAYELINSISTKIIKERISMGDFKPVLKEVRNTLKELIDYNDGEIGEAKGNIIFIDKKLGTISTPKKKNPFQEILLEIRLTQSSFKESTERKNLIISLSRRILDDFKEDKEMLLTETKESFWGDVNSETAVSMKAGDDFHSMHKSFFGRGL